MSQDYARKKNNSKHKNRSLWPPAILGFIFGAVTVAFLCLKLKPYCNLTENSFSKAQTNTSKKQEENKQAKTPVFDFYTILPEMEVVIADDIQSKSYPKTKTNNVGTNINGYVLQIASFRNYQDAETQKAKLALLGFEVKIEAVTVDGNKWHRVLMGPFNNINQAQNMKQKLQAQKINSLILKLQR